MTTRLDTLEELLGEVYQRIGLLQDVSVIPEELQIELLEMVYEATVQLDEIREELDA